MAYFGRAPKKPQQLGRVEGGRTKATLPGESVHVTRAAIQRLAAQGRTARPEAPGRAGRSVRSLRTGRSAR